MGDGRRRGRGGEGEEEEKKKMGKGKGGERKGLEELLPVFTSQANWTLGLL